MKVRYAQLRHRVDRTAAGQLHHRIQELEVMNKALLLSALALILFIPALITLIAVVPLGSEHSVGAEWARRLGLSQTAVHDVTQLFNTSHRVAGGATVLSSITTLVFAFGWPAELGRGYDIIWGLPFPDLRAAWRPLLWLFTFFAVIAAVIAAGDISAGIGGPLINGLIGLPAAIAWAWWTQHLLLGGRIAWRALLPGAVAIAVGLLGLRLYMGFYLQHAITDNYERYGPIGVVFALLSWMIGFSVVMLGGALAGHTYYQRKRARHPGMPDDSRRR
jgi:membrane protein